MEQSSKHAILSPTSLTCRDPVALFPLYCVRLRHICTAASHVASRHFVLHMQQNGGQAMQDFLPTVAHLTFVFPNDPDTVHMA